MRTIMLVLGRLVDQTIFVGESIAITVLRVDDGAVRLGISAPSEVNIFRGEHVEQVMAAISRLVR